MKKKTLAGIMICGFAFVMAACGNVETTNERAGTTKEQDTMYAGNETYKGKGYFSQEKASEKESKKEKMQLEVQLDGIDLQESEGFEFESNGDGTCTLKGMGTCNDTDIVIPEKSPEGDTVTKIAEYAFYGEKKITSVIIAGKVLEIDKNAFQTSELEKLIVSGSELEIGEHAFSYCDDIDEVYINNSSLDIGEYAFYDSGKDMKAILENCTGELENKAFQTCDIVNLSIGDSKLEIGEHTFSYCDHLTAASIENSNIEIGKYAFYDAGDDAEVNINNSSVEMRDKAFQTASVMTLSIQESGTIIGEHAFSYCEDLKNVTIGANDTEIDKYAFYGCASLENVAIATDSDNDSLKIAIKDKAFQNCAIQNLVIGRGEVNIGEHAFSYCENLTNAEFKGDSLEVRKYAFYSCPDSLQIKYKGEIYNKDSIEAVE